MRAPRRASVLVQEFESLRARHFAHHSEQNRELDLLRECRPTRLAFASGA
jgi:hypothetical protein